MSALGAGEGPGVYSPAQRAVHDRCRHPSGTFTPFAPQDIEQSVPARFAAQARRHPGRVAVAGRDASFTYAALAAAADRVAHALIARELAADRPVAVLLDHGAAAIVGILGVLKAGRAYVFLEPGLPPARLALLIEDSQVSVVVTDSAALALARTLVPATGILDIDPFRVRRGSARRDAAAADHGAEPPVGPDSWFNLIYTSGSTGQPKGVLNNHRNILDMVAKYTYNMCICPEDRVAQLAGGGSNTSVLTIFGALLNGAALHPLDMRAEGATRLAAWLGRDGITLLHTVPTAYRRLLDVLPRGGQLSALRVVCLGGEAVYRRDVERHRERVGPDVPLVHGLGCTELSVIRQFCVDGATPLPDRRVPVGYPIADREVLLLDEAGRSVAPGETGELVFRSRYLALGYWRRPELTREAFVQDPVDPAVRRYRPGDLGVLSEDGCLTHLGRQDFQVKIRGHRIETAEVELALLELPGVREVVVTARPGRAGDEELVAYVVPAGAPAPSPAELTAELEARLPSYMIPSAFVALAALPLTDTGKIDRGALPAPGRARALPAPPVAPRTALERTLVAIWAEVLELDEVGVDDEFLALGGNSLLAMQILAKIDTVLGADIPPSSLFNAATVAKMAALLVERERVSSARVARLDRRAR